MKKIMVIGIAIAFVAIFVVNTNAQVTRRADQRQKYQKSRVKNGAKSGEITKREAKSIRRSSANARRYEKKAKSDGVVTRKERRRIERKQDRTSRKIFRKKHNRRDRN